MKQNKEASSFSYQNQEKPKILTSDSYVEPNYIKKSSITSEEKIQNEGTYIENYSEIKQQKGSKKWMPKWL